MADGEEEEKKIVLAGAGEDEEKKIVVVGARDEEENKNVGGGEANGNGNGNGNGNQLLPPPGFRFTPKEDELVRYYLLPKLQGREHVPNDAIIEDNVYQSHPDTLIEKYKDKGEDSWYFLSPRARKYHNGDRPSRSTDDNRGRWKASTGTKVVVCDVGGGGSKATKSCQSKAMDVSGAGAGKIKYSESGLSYYEGPIKDESKSKWLMKEFTVPEYDKKRGKNAGGGGGGDRNMQLNQYVMCKIYVTPRKRGDDDDDDEAGPSGTEPEPEESGEGTTVGCEKLSEKQAGKRSAKEQSAAPTPKRAHHPDRLHLGPPAPLRGHGMHPPFRMPGPGYYGAPGRPMGYYARSPMPRPPVAYNNGQAPAAFSGQVTLPRQQAAYNGQVPLPRQQVAYNGQVQVPRQQVGFNGQMMRAPVLKLSPPYRPAGTPSSSGQNQTMMKRPPCPAGQAVNPPSSAVPRPAQMQKQPETEEMRASRVLQQHMEEYSRIMQSSTRPPAIAAHAAHQQRPPAPFTHQQQHQQLQRPMMAFTQHQQRPYFGANNASYHHHAGAMVPRFSLNNFYASEAAQHYQRSRLVPARSGSAGPWTATASASAESLVSSVVSGAGNAVSGANRDCSNDDEMEFVESATAGGSGSASAADDGDGPNYDDSAQ